MKKSELLIQNDIANIKNNQDKFYNQSEYLFPPQEKLVIQKTGEIDEKYDVNYKIQDIQIMQQQDIQKMIKNNKLKAKGQVDEQELNSNTSNNSSKREQKQQKKKIYVKRQRFNTCGERQIQTSNNYNNLNNYDLSYVVNKNYNNNNRQNKNQQYQQYNKDKEINSDGKMIENSYRNNYYCYTQQVENENEDQSQQFIQEEQNKDRSNNIELKQYLSSRLIKSEVKIDWNGIYKYVEILDSLYNRFYVDNLSDLCLKYHELLDNNILFDIENAFQATGNQKIIRMAQSLNNYIVIFIIMVQLDRQLSSQFSQKLQNTIQLGLINNLLIIDLIINSSQNGQILDKNNMEDIKIKRTINQWIIKFFKNSQQKPSNENKQINQSLNQGVINLLEEDNYNNIICHQFCAQFSSFTEENNKTNKHNIKYLDLKPACTNQCQKMFLININKLTNNIRYIKNVFNQISSKFVDLKIEKVSFSQFWGKHVVELQNQSVYNNFKQMREFLSQLLTNYQMNNPTLLPSNIEYLIVAPEPYLPKLEYTKENKKFSLIVDMDETLIHYREAGKDNSLYIRPFAKEFLSKMSEQFEIIIFTAGMPEYANWVLDQLDTEKKIDYRLFRQHTIRKARCYVKDLSRLGRDLSKCIIIDNLEQNFQLQKQNGIFVKSWYGDDNNDTVLKELMPYLQKIHTQNCSDVFSIVKQIQDKDIGESKFNEPLPPYLRL
ncbi:HAD-like domain [Pseudocohnilembus persalinus]|uniref:HAD-like domain n=1 Tax=Pseudocohnilembus persalinus TaxID=266149 RepID=A0A0V0QH59_PSEPJ|nr:HAD-like domain [Pseudocohnilembus persalinus]|eukprot:KRX01508.1 HAD-like domain [Pseudocohnilembus persalinus]